MENKRNDGDMAYLYSILGFLRRLSDKNEKVYLTNGTTGFVENVYKDTFNGKTMTIDFRPDYSKKSFKNVTFDYNHLYAVPGQEDDNNDFTSHFNDKIESRISNNSPLNCDLPIINHEKEDDKNNIIIERINTDSLISKDISSFLDSDEVMKKYTKFTISKKAKQKMIQTIDDNELINSVVDYLKDREDFYTILTTISSRIIELRKIKDND